MSRFTRLAIAATAVISLGAPMAMAASHADKPTPVIFVHGDSDTAANWKTTIWRFESNGYPSDRLFAVDLDNPAARSDDTKPQPNRSSTTDVASQLGGFVTRVLLNTGAKKVALVGNSRGCQTIRNYVENGGGAALTETLVLTGCVHHGVFVAPGVAMGSEYNGAGHFLTKLNADGEVIDGIKTVTIRSDRFDLYNQPMGDFIGQPGQPIGGSFEGPELEGADNRVLEGVDHRETAYSPRAFAIMYEAITGTPPKTTGIERATDITLNGEVSGWANERPTNLPLSGAKIRVWAVNATTGARIGDKPVHESTATRRGKWGPFEAQAGQAYEFVVRAEGYPVHHIYRAPFPRSSEYVNLRLYPLAEEAKGKTAAIGMMRPRGYFGADDTVTFNGKRAGGINESPVPNKWQSWHVTEKAGEPVVAEFNGEKIAARTWPTDGHVAWIELHH
ncbi:twin-arginine translocation pathway signal [Minwuia sp.]|uniref:twin-arginine translocation pathway signal n=1 Tax=Minwuia sp. TaxID=2493630 RepID=UPI003A93498E